MGLVSGRKCRVIRDTLVDDTSDILVDEESPVKRSFAKVLVAPRDVAQDAADLHTQTSNETPIFPIYYSRIEKHKRIYYLCHFHSLNNAYIRRYEKIPSRETSANHGLEAPW